MASKKIMILDNDENVLEVVAAMLEAPEYEFIKYSNAEEALNVAKRAVLDLVVTDLKMDPVDGLEVLKQIKKMMPEVEVLIMTAHATVETAIEAMKEGAFDYLVKPVKMEELQIVVRRALAHQQMRKENIYLKNQLQERHGIAGMAGKSQPMQKVFSLIRKVAPSDMTVLIQGESGTGKELVAKAIHYGSSRKDYPFVAINCGAIPETLLESELFGHVKGAFTGAIANKKGLFEAAEKGTIFLDEISATSPALQVNLLRVLQEKEYRRVGDSKNQRMDVRVLAATNLDLEQEVKKGKFREDLFYRLNVITISLPPLRQRKEDIPLLAEHFLSKYRRHGAVKTLGESAFALLMRYDWPGNVRELEHVMEQAASFSNAQTVQKEDLPDKLREISAPAAPAGDNGHLGLKEFLKLQEKILIEKILAEAMADKKKAADRLGISLPSLYRKIEELGIDIHL